MGELAEATGLTVRTLHHYDKVGLLAPSDRTLAGHRMYGEEEVRRLYRILALRRLGLRLEEIASVLDEGRLGLVETVRSHLERVERDLQQQVRLRRRLTRILDALDRSVEPSIDQFIDALEAMAVIEATLEDVVVPVPNEEAEDDAGPFSRHGQPVMLLKEHEGERVLPIWIGHPEAGALAVQLAGGATPRPLSQDLMARLVEAAGARIERVSVSSRRENTFFATVTVVTGDESREVDARPSDAMNLAARVGAPIFVDQQIMDECSVPNRAEVAARLASCGGPHREPSESPQAPGDWRSLVPTPGTHGSQGAG